MNKHQIIWTALPNGFGTDSKGNPDPNKPLLSLYISLRLKADGEGHSLSDFAGIAAEWPILLKGLRFNVEGIGQGSSANWINPNAPSNGLWNALFRPTTPVKTFSFHDLSQQPIISFPAYWLSVRLASHYLQLAAASPGRVPPAASLKQFTDPASRLAGVLDKRFSGILTHERHNLWALVRTGKVESIQQALKALEDPQIVNGSSSKEIASAKEPLQDLLFFAQTFRFLAHFGVPPSGRDPHHRPKLPDFNFHQLLAIVSEYPSLMRALGLVIDLQVTGPVSQDSFKIRVLPKWQLEEADFIVPWTHFDPTSFKPVGRNGAPSNFLALENGEFRLTEMDAAGAAVKFTQTMQAVARTKQDQPQGLPSLRTGGLALAWCGQQPTYPKEGSFRVQKFTERMQTQKSLNDALASGSQIPEFFAEDLVRGYFVDIFDSNGQGVWKSLCERTITCQPGNFTADEEGAVTTSVTQGALPSASPSGDPSHPAPLHLPETLFRWNGESLVVPRREPPPSQDSPGGPTSNPSPVGVAITAKQRGKLPPLRFGHTYKVRMRKVDLAGNAVPVEFDSPSYLKHNFARLEPVNPPVLRPVRSATAGESIEQLVVRSPLANPDKPCVRILMAPECSPVMAERHGMFDDAMGHPLDKNQVQAWLVGKIPNAQAAANQSKSALFNTMIPKAVETPDYLSDPMAAGVLCRPVIDGPSPNPISVQLPFATGTPIPHGPDWPLKPVGFIVKRVARNDHTPVDLIPYIKDDSFILDLPQAEVRRFWLSSLIALDPTDPQKRLPLFAVYNGLQEGHASEAAKLAQSGVCWMLMPYREITVVHAVPQPLDLPSFMGFALNQRQVGETFVSLTGKLHVHAKSTAKVEIEAQWYEFIDDPALGDPMLGESKSASVCHFHVEMPKNAVLPPKATEPGENLVDINKGGKTVIQSFGDTKYRRVFYTAIATSRFAEYWDPKDANSPKDFTCKSGPPEPQSVPSTTRPAAPKVLYAIPAFKWLSSPDGVSSTREGGWLRIYLDRPWYSSGEGEKLGVVLGQQSLAKTPPEQQKLVTFWGSDPVWPSDEPPANPSPFPSGLKDFSDVHLDEDAAVTVTVKLYDVQWDSSRKLWFCDVQMNVSSTYFPFVRLALVRFQENSLSVKGGPDLRVSRVVLTEPLQVLPTRTLSVEPEQSDVSPGQTALVITVEGKTHKSGIANTFEVHVETTQTGAAPSGDFDWIQIGPDAQGGPSLNSDQLWTGFWAGVPTVPGQSAIPLRVVVKEMEHYSQPSWSPNQPDQSVVTSSRIVYADAFQI